MNLDDKNYKAGNILAKISMLKNCLVSPAAYESDYENQRNDYFKKIILVRDNIKIRRDESGIVTMGILDFLLNSNSLEL